MQLDGHIHMVLDGKNWRQAIAAHSRKPNTQWIAAQLAQYQRLGFTYLRDGGDRWGVCLAAREMARDYGITYRCPAFPIYKEGRYGGFIGRSFSNLQEYRALVTEVRRLGGDFIKIMIAGLMDFNQYGKLSCDGLDAGEIREMVRIAHGEGFPVMAHANGAGTVRLAAEAGVDSVEHGAYLDAKALGAMVEHNVIWTPTLATIGNLRGKGRFQEAAVEEILQSAKENVRRFAAMGGLLAPGSDAGAWQVLHGQGGLDEYGLLERTLGESLLPALKTGEMALQRRFG